MKPNPSQQKVIDQHLYTGCEVLNVSDNRGVTISVWIKTPTGKTFLEIGRRGKVYTKQHV